MAKDLAELRHHDYQHLHDKFEVLNAKLLKKEEEEKKKEPIQPVQQP